MNSFTFDTRADYIAAKGSSGAIYAALQGATGIVSASAVSFIKATGETLVDAMNVFVGPDKGDIGDTLYYITTSSYAGFKWLKSKAGWSATSYGQTFFKSALIPSSYVEVGVLVHRKGNVGLIMRNTGQGIAWCPQDYESVTVPGVVTYGGSNNKVGDGTVCTYCSHSRAYAEERWGTSYYQYSWPFPKSAWNAMMDKVWANTAGSGSDSTNWSWTVTANTSAGVGTASFTCTGPYGSITSNPADYHYDFEEWYKKRILIQWPTTANVANDFQGRANTKAIVRWANNLSTPLTTSNCAAKYCNDTVAASNVPGYTAGNWWLPSMGELLNACRNHALLKAKGTQFLSSSYSIWSSTQYSAASAWSAYDGGLLNDNYKRNGYRVCAVSAFQF